MQLINTYLKGGAAKACCRLHNGFLKTRNINSSLLFARNSIVNLTLANRYKMNFSNSIEILYFLFTEHLRKSKINDIETFENPITPYRINCLKSYLESDIINLHWVSNFIDYPTFFTDKLKPIVWTLHDMQPFTGGYPYESFLPYDKYASIISKNLDVKTKALKGCNIHVVCPSSWMAAKSEKSDLLKDFPHYVIPNGVDTDVYKIYHKKTVLESLNLPNDKKIILFVASQIDNPRKGLNFLIEAFNLLQDYKIASQEEPIICLVGENSESIDVLPNLYKLGVIKEEKMAMIYSVADVLIVPSIEDNLPNTIIESLCCGTPVIGFNVGGMPDMIQDSQNGFLVLPKDSKALAKSMILALNKNWNRNLIRKNAVAKYDISVQVKRYESLFQEILKVKTYKSTAD